MTNLEWDGLIGKLDQINGNICTLIENTNKQSKKREEQLKWIVMCFDSLHNLLGLDETKRTKGDMSGAWVAMKNHEIPGVLDCLLSIEGNLHLIQEKLTEGK